MSKLKAAEPRLLQERVLDREQWPSLSLLSGQKKRAAPPVPKITQKPPVAKKNIWDLALNLQTMGAAPMGAAKSAPMGAAMGAPAMRAPMGAAMGAAMGAPAMRAPMRAPAMRAAMRAPMGAAMGAPEMGAVEEDIQNIQTILQKLTEPRIKWELRNLSTPSDIYNLGKILDTKAISNIETVEVFPRVESPGGAGAASAQKSATVWRYWNSNLSLKINNIFTTIFIHYFNRYCMNIGVILNPLPQAIVMNEYAFNTKIGQYEYTLMFKFAIQNRDDSPLKDIRNTGNDMIHLTCHSNPTTSSTHLVKRLGKKACQYHETTATGQVVLAHNKREYIRLKVTMDSDSGINLVKDLEYDNTSSAKNVYKVTDIHSTILQINEGMINNSGKVDIPVLVFINSIKVFINYMCVFGVQVGSTDLCTVIPETISNEELKFIINEYHLKYSPSEPLSINPDQTKLSGGGSGRKILDYNDMFGQTWTNSYNSLFDEIKEEINDMKKMEYINISAYGGYLNNYMETKLKYLQLKKKLNI